MNYEEQELFENFESFGEELSESLGNLKQVSADSKYLEIVKLALKKRAAIGLSPNSKVSAIKGKTFAEFINDVKQSDKQGRYTMIYLETSSGSHVIVNAEFYNDRAVGLNSEVKFLTVSKYSEDALDIDDGSSWRSTFKPRRFKNIEGRLNITDGYSGFIVYGDYETLKKVNRRTAS